MALAGRRYGTLVSLARLVQLFYILRRGIAFAFFRNSHGERSNLGPNPISLSDERCYLPVSWQRPVGLLRRQLESQSPPSTPNSLAANRVWGFIFLPFPFCRLLLQHRTITVSQKARTASHDPLLSAIERIMVWREKSLPLR